MSVNQGPYNCPVCRSQLTNGYCYHCGRQMFQTVPSTQYGMGNAPIPPPPPPDAKTLPMQQGTMFSGGSQPPSGPQSRTKKASLIIGTIGALVVLISGGLFWEISANNQKNKQIQATATAQTQLANGHLTATARAQAAAATATAIPLHDNFVPDGATATLVLADPLTTANKWKESTNSGGGTCQFNAMESGYIVTEPSTTSYKDCEATPVGAAYADLTF